MGENQWEGYRQQEVTRAWIEEVREAVASW